MSDFFQNGVITTLHRLNRNGLRELEGQLDELAESNRIGLILPALYTEFQHPAMRRIVDQLAQVHYLKRIVCAVGQATREQYEHACTFFRDVPTPVTMLWMEDPRIEKLFVTLEQHGIGAGGAGTGAVHQGEFRNGLLNGPGLMRHASGQLDRLRRAETDGVDVGDGEACAFPRQRQGERSADAGSGSGDHHDASGEFAHRAAASRMVGSPTAVSGAGDVRSAEATLRYASRSNFLVIRRNWKVKPGHNVVLLPCLSRYQLAQPPLFHTLDFRASCNDRL